MKSKTTSDDAMKYRRSFHKKRSKENCTIKRKEIFFEHRMETLRGLEVMGLEETGTTSEKNVGGRQICNLNSG